MEPPTLREAIVVGHVGSFERSVVLANERPDAIRAAWIVEGKPSRWTDVYAANVTNRAERLLFAQHLYRTGRMSDNLRDGETL